MSDQKSNTARDVGQGVGSTMRAPERPVRVWAPKQGERVKLRTWDDYVSRGIGVWAWLRVEQVCMAVNTVDWTDNVDLTVLDGDRDTGRAVTVPLASIQAPIGWKDRYTITVSPGKVGEVLQWFRDKRGIAVLQSHYMPSCPTAFAPADNQGTRDWRFNGADKEVIPPELCDDVFRVVKLETWHDVSIPCACEYCEHGKRTRESNPQLIGQDTQVCEHCGVIAGFSFDQPYHARSYVFGRTDGQCDRVRQAAECWVCDGLGIGRRYLTSIKDRKEKDKAKRELQAQGWVLRYVNAGKHSAWVGERETVVKDWGEAVPPVSESGEVSNA